MSPRAFLVALLSTLTVAMCSAETVRFSQSLTADERAATGVARLDSDQSAALDALVRLHLTQAAAAAQKAERAKAAGQTDTVAEPAVAFSTSLSTDQQKAAGIDTLTASEKAAIDSLVAALDPGAPQYVAPAPKSVEAVKFFPNRYEIHGEIGFGLGFGSGGYSSREAWLTTSMLDTKTGMEISITVASSSEKWKRPFGYRYDWDTTSFGLSTPLLAIP